MHGLYTGLYEEMERVGSRFWGPYDRDHSILRARGVEQDIGTTKRNTYNA